MSIWQFTLTTVATAPLAPRPKSFADVAKLRRQVFVNDIIRKNVAARKEHLVKWGFIRCPTAKLVAVYFGCVQHGLIGHFIKCVLQPGALPSWACLAVSFIGSSSVEMLCHKPLTARLIATMKHIGFSHLPSYDPFKARTRSQLVEKIAKGCVRRYTRLADQCPVSSGKLFHKVKLSVLDSRYPKTLRYAPDAWRAPQIQTETPQTMPMVTGGAIPKNGAERKVGDDAFQSQTPQNSSANGSGISSQCVAEMFDATRTSETVTASRDLDAPSMLLSFS